MQTNKAKIAVSLFDFIHSIDNKKLADKISKCQKEQNKKLKLFIQVNIGNESQKSGISKDNLFISMISQKFRFKYNRSNVHTSF